MENRLGFGFKFYSKNSEADDHWSNHEWSMFYDVSSVPHVGDHIDFNYIFNHVSHKESLIDTANNYKRFLEDYKCVRFNVISREFKPLDVMDNEDVKIGLWCDYTLTIAPIKEMTGAKNVERHYNALKNRLGFLTTK